MSRSPLVSILLPTHNRADVLRFAIQSVLAQTLADFELLIAGDGCTDDTATVVQGFADSRIRWFDLPKAPNFGYANRNIVLREARGTFIAFMAHDDLWLPDHLERILKRFDDPMVEIAYSRPLYVIPKGLIVPSTFNLDREPVYHTFMNREGNGIPAGCVVHRRECFDKYGMWNEDLPRGGDSDLWIRIISGGGGANFAFDPVPTNLHFKANWRDDRFGREMGFDLWKHMFSVPGLCPKILNVRVGDGQTEQEAVWLAMSANPRQWTLQMRAAINVLYDFVVSQMFWLYTHHAFGTVVRDTEAYRLRLPFADMAAALQVRRDLVQQNQSLSSELDAIKRTITWRLHKRMARSFLGKYYSRFVSLFRPADR